MFQYINGQRSKVQEDEKKQVVEGFNTPSLNDQLMGVPVWVLVVAVLALLLLVLWHRKRSASDNVIDIGGGSSSASEAAEGQFAFRFY